MLVTTSITGCHVTATIGCGINLNNTKPTLSINQVIQDSGGSKPLSLEHFLASIFNKLEELSRLIYSGRLIHVLDMYHEHWLHRDAPITIRTAENVATSAKILGIDEYGFLRAKPVDGPSVTVHPDGNSFDMLNGLIVPKANR